MFLFVALFVLDFAQGFTCSTTRSATTCRSPISNSPSRAHSSDVEKRRRLSTYLREKPGWLDDAIGGMSSGDDGGFDEESYKKGIQLKPGIAGFSVDRELGFVCILAGNSDDENTKNRFWIPVVVSPVDKDRPKSAEALTCVQLAGGLDLGTAILPPNSLAKLVADESSEKLEKKSDVPTRYSLTKISAMANPDAAKEKISIEEEVKEIVPTSPEREQAIIWAVPKVETAVKSLPGLQECTREDVIEAMQRFANEKGEVDRPAFSSILDSLRALKTPSIRLTPPVFRLEVSVIDGEGISQVTAETTNAMIALGLAMRYKVTVDIEENDGHEQAGNGIDALLERFPEFKPVQELSEDSRIMDGFIPSMFEKAKLDNDMKGE